MSNSPYEGKSEDEWSEVTRKLLIDYPLSIDEIREVAILCWDRLWSSTIGGEIIISEVELPATVVGYFFQKLFAHELSVRYPDIWVGEQDKRDKDLVNLMDRNFSTEMKSSGQMGYQLFGNRSYNQEAQSGSKAGKTKSGYYITLNFSGQIMTLLRVGWIDQDDWVPQGAETGQAAVLKPDVYKYKLVEIPGEYRKQAPVQLLKGVGPAKIGALSELGINTFNDLIQYNGDDKMVCKIKNDNIDFLNSL